MKIRLVALCFLLGSACCSCLTKQSEVVTPTKIAGQTVKETVTSGAAVTAPLVVSVIALVSAAVSVLLSLKVKDKEYLNDYYKKVIEKRMQAIDSAEAFINDLSVFIEVHTFRIGSFEAKASEKGGELNLNFKQVPYIFKVHYCLFDEQTRAKYEFRQSDSPKTTTWSSPSSEELLTSLHSLVSDIIAESKSLEEEPKLILLETKYQAVELLKLRLEASLNDDMTNLYDVPAFFKAKKAHTANMVNQQVLAGAGASNSAAS